MKRIAALYGIFQFILLLPANYYTEAIDACSIPGFITLWAISTVFFTQVCYWIHLAKRKSRRRD